MNNLSLQMALLLLVLPQYHSYAETKWSSQSLYHLIFPYVSPFISVDLDYNSLNVET